MKTSFRIACTVAITTLLLAVTTSAQEPENRGDDAVLKRLDQILLRLENIESRIQKLEDGARNSIDWQVDKFGYLRKKNGDLLGVWGVDFVPQRATRPLK